MIIWNVHMNYSFWTVAPQNPIHSGDFLDMVLKQVILGISLILLF